MEVKATLRYYRKGARKVKPVIDLIRGRSLADAEAQLTFVKREPAKVVLKLLQSAAANAVHNNKLERSNLFVKEVMANQGPTIKRFDPRAMGRAYTIRKRTSHLTIVLAEKVPTVAAAKVEAPAADAKEVKEAKVEKKSAPKKTAAKKPAAKKTTK